MVVRAFPDPALHPETFSGPDEAILAWESGCLDLHEPIKVRNSGQGSIKRSLRYTTVGRLRLSLLLLKDMRDIKETIGKKQLGKLISRCLEVHGGSRSVRPLDDLTNIGEEAARNIEAAGIKRVAIRSVLTCEASKGVCAHCYGRDPATGEWVELGAADRVRGQGLSQPRNERLLG